MVMDNIYHVKLSRMELSMISCPMMGWLHQIVPWQVGYDEMAAASWLK